MKNEFPPKGYDKTVKEIFPSLSDFNISNVPTKDMVKKDLSKYQFRVDCPLCGKPILASNFPIPQDFVEFATGTPCSTCSNSCL